MSLSRLFVWNAVVLLFAVHAVHAQQPYPCAPGGPMGYGAPGQFGHWIYAQLPPYPAWYYQAYGNNANDPRWPRIPGPDATGRTQLNPALPYKNFEEYLKSQAGTVPPTPVPPVPVPAKGQSATLEIHVDDAKAEVFINDQPTKQTGLIRVFQTPPLSGAKSTFRVKASWGNIITGFSETREVTVEPGKSTTVIFTEKKKD